MKKLALISTMCIAIVGCGSDTDKVKNGILEFNKTITVGQALDNWKSCESKSWEEFSADNGVKVVQFTCNHKVKEYIQKLKSYSASEINKGAIYLDIVSYSQKFQFTINKDDTFQIHNISSETQWSDGEKVSNGNQEAMEELQLAYANKINMDQSELNEFSAPQFAFALKFVKPGEKYKKEPQKVAASAPAESKQNGSLCQDNEIDVFSCVSENNVTYSLCSSNDVTPSSGYLQLHFKSDKGAGFVPEQKIHPSQFVTADTLIFSGGGGAYLRLKSGEKINYVVYSAIGKGFDKQGVAIEVDGKVSLDNVCKNIATNEIGQEFFDNNFIPKDSLGFEVPFDEIEVGTQPENIQAASESTSKKWPPSFNCNKASTFVEKSICSVPLLGSLDGALSENYKYMLASNIGDGAIEDLKSTQKKWMSDRNKCTSTQCIEEFYRSRIDEVCEYPVISGVHPICTRAEEIK